MVEVKNELKGDLSADQLKKIKNEITECLARNRHSILCNYPFTGNIAMRFDLIPVRDKRCMTACTDYSKIFVSCSFWASLTFEQQNFVLAHELWHAIMLHNHRRQTRDAEFWNYAADMEVNNLLSDHSSGKGIQPPDEILFPPSKLRGKSAEVIYDALLKAAQQNKLKQMVQQGQQDHKNGRGGRGGYGNDDDDQQQQSGRRQRSQDGQSGRQSGGQMERPDSSQDGKNSGELKGQFDQHDYGEDSEDQQNGQNSQDGKNGKGQGQGKDKKDGQGGCSDQWGEVGYDEDFRPHMSEDAAERMREAVVSAAQSYTKEHGNLPAGIEGLVGKLMKPEVNWRERLCAFVSSIPGGKRRWLPPSRRRLYDDMYFQSRRNEALKIAVAVDTSGSCIGELPKFFGELKGLIESFGSYELHLLEADAAVDRYRFFDANDPLDLDDVSHLDFSGGGGTAYEPAIEYVEEHDFDIDCMIYIGDGYVSKVTRDQPKFPFMWVISKDGTEDFCDWGEKIRLKEGGYDY